MRCVECGAETAEAPAICARCGAPPVWLPSVSLDPAAGGPGHHVETATGPAKGAGPWPAWVRWVFMIFLICSLILFTIGVAGAEATAPGTGRHAMMVSVSWLSIAGALLFLALFERARYQFAKTQLGWAMVPLLSLGLLACVPFGWLALGRRRARDWVVFAVYLAATATVIVALSSVPADVSITGLPGVTMIVLLVVAPVHTVVAFSPVAKVPTGSDVYRRPGPGRRELRHYPAGVDKREQPEIDAVLLGDPQPEHPDKPQRAPQGADRIERWTRGTFGCLGLLAGLAALLLWPDPSMGGGDSLPPRWWAVLGVCAVVAAACWAAARSRLPRWLAEHLAGGEK